MISFRAKSEKERERERETAGFTTLQETRNNRRPSRIKQWLGKNGRRGFTKRWTYVCIHTHIHVLTYVCAVSRRSQVIVRFLSRRSSQICRVVKVKCLAVASCPPLRLYKPYSSTVEFKRSPPLPSTRSKMESVHTWPRVTYPILSHDKIKAK